MGKLFVAVAVSALALAATAQAQTQAQPEARILPVKVEQVTAAAHLTYRDPEHNALVESNLMMVGEVPAMADAGCRMRDTASDAAPSGPRAPSGQPRAPQRPDEAPPARPKGRWTACS